MKPPPDTSWIEMTTRPGGRPHRGHHTLSAASRAKVAAALRGNRHRQPYRGRRPLTDDDFDPTMWLTPDDRRWLADQWSLTLPSALR